ncbi:hypothetical protein BpHYR1_036789, partial [Brachionus plicatilis]
SCLQQAIFPPLCLEHSRFQLYLHHNRRLFFVRSPFPRIDSTEPHDFIHGRCLLTSVLIQSVLELVDGYGLNDLLGALLVGWKWSDKAVLVGASSCSTVDFDRQGYVPVYNVGACVTFIELNKITSSHIICFIRKSKIHELSRRTLVEMVSSFERELFTETLNFLLATNKSNGIKPQNSSVVTLMKNEMNGLIIS